jgi:hypothetical protein
MTEYDYLATLYRACQTARLGNKDPVPRMERRHHRGRRNGEGLYQHGAHQDRGEHRHDQHKAQFGQTPTTTAAANRLAFVCRARRRLVHLEPVEIEPL